MLVRQLKCQLTGKNVQNFYELHEPAQSENVRISENIGLIQGVFRSLKFNTSVGKITQLTLSLSVNKTTDRLVM